MDKLGQGGVPKDQGCAVKATEKGATSKISRRRTDRKDQGRTKGQLQGITLMDTTISRQHQWTTPRAISRDDIKSNIKGECPETDQETVSKDAGKIKRCWNE